MVGEKRQCGAVSEEGATDFVNVRQRAIARSYANVYRRKGKLKPELCEVCGDEQVQMHHDDYGKPLKVRWLCHLHHLQLHRGRYWRDRARDNRVPVQGAAHA